MLANEYASHFPALMASSIESNFRYHHNSYYPLGLSELLFTYVQSRAHLDEDHLILLSCGEGSGFSAKRFHSISLLLGSVRDVRTRQRMC